MKVRIAATAFGHPRFAEAIVTAFPHFFEVLPRLSGSFNSIADKRRRRLNLQDKVVLNLSRMAGIAMEELVVLAGNGFGTGAMKIARNILELAINAEFLRMNPTAVDDYIEWFWIEQHNG